MSRSQHTGLIRRHLTEENGEQNSPTKNSTGAMTPRRQLRKIELNVRQMWLGLAQKSAGRLRFRPFWHLINRYLERHCGQQPHNDVYLSFEQRVLLKVIICTSQNSLQAGSKPTKTNYHCHTRVKCHTRAHHVTWSRVPSLAMQRQLMKRM